MRIKSKAEFYRLWEAGCLGNKLQTWREAGEAHDSGVPIVGFRQVGIAGGGKFEVVNRSEILETAVKWRALGLDYVVCEAAPDERGTIQGEVCRTVAGLQGTLGYSAGLRMRDAIARGLLTPRSPAATLALIHKYMDPSSQDDLWALLDLYPEATVEFTCYEVMVGCLPGRNTIFWEVRDY